MISEEAIQIYEGDGVRVPLPDDALNLADSLKEPVEEAIKIAKEYHSYFDNMVFQDGECFSSEYCFLCLVPRRCIDFMKYCQTGRELREQLSSIYRMENSLAYNKSLLEKYGLSYKVLKDIYDDLKLLTVASERIGRQTILSYNDIKENIIGIMKICQS